MNQKSMPWHASLIAMVLLCGSLASCTSPDQPPAGGSGGGGDQVAASRDGSSSGATPGPQQPSSSDDSTASGTGAGGTAGTGAPAQSSPAGTTPGGASEGGTSGQPAGASGGGSAGGQSPTTQSTAGSTVASPAVRIGVAEELAEEHLPPPPVGVGPYDWPQWGGTSHRNNTPNIAPGTKIPTYWEVGEFDEETGEWIPGTGKNIKWVARLGSQSYGNPVIANGQVYVGTNNGAGWVKRYPPDVDLGCLIAFRESDGKFLWQHCNEKLPQGRVNDWQLQGICCAPLVEGERLWYVSSRGVVNCLDTRGFYDDENDGPFTDEPNENKDEADVVWAFDMMKELNLFQHNMCSCSVTAAGDYLFVITSNGVDESHIHIPSPECPSFICLRKDTGELLWADKSPGLNILHGQWSSPAYAVLGGQPQVLFPGGDGWLYSFDPEGDGQGNAKLLWKFDCNPKESKWVLGGRGTRNNLISTPVVYKGKVYICVGQDPEHGEGEGHLWCIDPTRRGDVSPWLVYSADNPTEPLAHRRVQAALPGDIVRDNPNSAAVWHYHTYDQDGDGQIDFHEEMHRSVSTVCIKDDILYAVDFSGLVHCVDAQTGKVYWTYDMLAAAWGSPLIVGGHVYIGDEDGDISVFRHSKDPKVAMHEIGGELHPISVREVNGRPEMLNMGNSVYSTPVVANGVLYVANKTHLFAIAYPEGEASAQANE
jgi:outer membrane protein assembly factor BamB